MASPIKETPVLTGKDSVRFVKDNENVIPASEQEKREIRESYEALKSIAKFAI